jgi:predicted dehydrogenase
MLELGIIGAGIMGERLARAALGQAADSVRLVGIWDPSVPAMARISAELPQVPQFGSVEALTEASQCVYVASPPASHLGHARRALAEGRSVFCEKPLAVDLAESRAFLAEAAGARIAVNFPFASSFAVGKLTEWMASIGTPHSLVIDVAFRVWPRPWQHDAASWLDRRAEGGFTREVVSHFLFLSRRLLGPLVLGEHLVQFPADGRSEPKVGRSEFDIRAALTAGGVEVHLTGNVGNTPKDDHNAWTLRGDAGAIRLRDWSIAERQLPNGTWEPDPDALPNERMRPLVLKRQLDGVARMTSGEPHPLATIQEAFDVQTVVEAILAG